jgi:hypothetical protein
MIVRAAWGLLFLFSQIGFTPSASAMTRSDDIVFSDDGTFVVSGGNNLGVIDSANGFAYTVTTTSLVKIDLSSQKKVLSVPLGDLGIGRSITLDTPRNCLYVTGSGGSSKIERFSLSDLSLTGTIDTMQLPITLAVLDTAAGYGYFGYQSLLRVDLNQFTIKDQLTLGTNEASFQTAVIDKTTGYLYCGFSASSKIAIMKIRLSDFSRIATVNVPATVYAVTFALDSANHALIVGAGQRLYRVNLDTFTLDPTSLDMTTDGYLYTSIIDPIAGILYLPLYNPNAQGVTRIQLSNFTKMDKVSMAIGGVKGIIMSMFDPSTRIAYCGSFETPATLYPIHLPDMTLKASIPYSTGLNSIVGNFLDKSKENLILVSRGNATNKIPSVIAKVRLSDHSIVQVKVLSIPDYIFACDLDPNTNMLYLVTSNAPSPSDIIKYDVSNLTEVQRLTLSPDSTLISSLHIDSAHQTAYYATYSKTSTFVKLNLNPLSEIGGTSFANGRPNQFVLDPSANVAYVTTGYDPITVTKVDLQNNYTILASSTLSAGTPINALYLDKPHDALIAAGKGMVKLRASDLTTLLSIPRVLFESDFQNIGADDQTNYGFAGENIQGVATIKAIQLSDLSTLEIFSLDASEILGYTPTIIDEGHGQGLFAYNKTSDLARMAVFSLDVKNVPSPGSVQFNSAAYNISEGDSSLMVTATRTGGTSGAISVTYATASGTAVAGSDFTAARGTLSWADGDAANKTFTVPITDDTIFEGNEIFTMALSLPTGGAILGTQVSATATIVDNDVANPGTLQLAQANYSVDESGPSLSVAVTRSGGINGAVSVTYTTSNGTAVSGSDYTATTGTLSWADGVTGTKTFSIPITDDTAFEGTETFNVSINTPSGGATLGSQSSAVISIVDNDTAKPGSLQIEHATYSINESGTALNVAVTRTGGSDGVVSVAYATSNGTAQAGADYTSTSGTLSWASGDAAAKTFSVPITDDQTNEGNETFNIAINTPGGGAVLGPTTAAVATILDNEIAQPGTFSFGSASYTVNENGSTLSVSVGRSNGKDGAVSVGYKTVDGTALAGSDYTSASGTLSWADGADDTKTFSVTIKDDQLIEGDETFALQLQSPGGGAVLGNVPTTTVTIVDNETAAPGTLAFGQASMEVNENVGTITIPVKRIGGSDGAVSVRYVTSDGSALAGSDYAANAGTLSWANGDSSVKNISVPIINDTLIEPKESFAFSITQPTGGATMGSPSSIDVLIDDDDLNPVGSPTLGLVTPNQGSVKGGTRVTLRGTGFMNGTTASFAGKQATNITFIDAQTLQAITPEGTVGWADVVVRNPNAMEATLSDGFEFIDVSSDAPASSHANVVPTVSVHSTPIRFNNLPVGAVVRIYSSRGQVMAALNESNGSAVWNLVSNGRTVASGTYMYRIDGGIKGRIIVVR